MGNTYKSPLQAPEPKLIYALRVDKLHPGYLKIGDTKLEDGYGAALAPNSPEMKAAAEKRIKNYSNELSLDFDVDYVELTLYIKNGEVKSFRDYDVHKVLERSGYPKVKFEEAKTNGAEWFQVDVATVKAAIQAVKEGKQSIQGNEQPIAEQRKKIEFRPEQIEAIQRTLKVFRKKPDTREMLWDAKMRFGKTLTALQVVREMAFKRTLIITHRPVVDDGWFKDFEKIFFDTQDYRYGSKENGDSYGALEDFIGGGLFSNPNGHYIYFSSIQYLREKVLTGDIEEKTALLNTQWDCIIIDEAHEGTQTDLAQSLFSKLIKENTYVLSLSGTPFNIKEQFSDEQVFTWDYIMEQEAKRNWEIEHFGAPNPYADLPNMNIYTFDLGDLLNLNYAINEQTLEDQAFSFSEFFRVWTGDLDKDHKVLPSLDHRGRFVHEQDVRRFLTLISTPDEDNHFPYATEEYCDFFRHTLWMVPGVPAAKALSALIKETPAFKDFTVVNVAGEGDDDDSREESLQKLRNAIGPDARQSHTITLSCNRLTTGVTVPEWTGVLMLKGSVKTDAKAYMQTIFRVQSPYKTPDGKRKEDCYVFDFAPDRTLQVISQAAHINSKNTDQGQRDYLDHFLNFCPVIGYNGTRMTPYDTTNMLETLKRIQIDRVVRRGFEDSRLYNDQLFEIDDTAIALLEHLKDSVGTTQKSRGDDTLVLSESNMGKRKGEKKKRVKKDESQLTPEERERRRKQQNRRAAINILHGISIRIPLLIYGAELESNEDLMPDNLTAKVDKKSWEEFMPKGVTQKDFNAISRFYDGDVFRAAGRRIRDLAAAADRLEPTERAKKIAQIFSYFHNPDKETVLTPWRVVNMHMSDTLGGYDFFDETHVNEGLLEEPRLVNRGEVTANVFNPTTRILEINSKTGLYPLYVAYSTYRSRLAALEQSMFGEHVLSAEEKTRLWNQTVDENIYVVCRTNMAASITKRTLGAFREDAPHHIACYKKLNETLRDNPEEFVERVGYLKLFYEYNQKTMIRFNAVVGNPPYQEMDGGKTGAMPVYQLFVSAAKDLHPSYISLIMPSRWFAGGRGLDDFRVEMLNDRRIERLYDYPKSRDCFPTVDIAGGICYFLWNKDADSDCTIVSRIGNNENVATRKLNEYDIFIRDNVAIDIVNQVKKQTSESLMNLVLNVSPFGLRSFVRGEEQEKPNSVIVCSSAGRGYIPRSEVQKNQDKIDLYKVSVGYLNPDRAGVNNAADGKSNVTTKVAILNPGEVLTETYIVLGTFQTLEEAQNYASYIKTKFVRFLVFITLSSMHITRDSFQFVPIQNFHESWTDEKLYAKYGISKEEQQYIESLIKPME